MGNNIPDRWEWRQIAVVGGLWFISEFGNIHLEDHTQTLNRLMCSRIPPRLPRFHFQTMHSTFFLWLSMLACNGRLVTAPWRTVLIESVLRVITTVSGQSLHLHPPLTHRVLPAAGRDHPPHLAGGATSRQVRPLHHDSGYIQVKIPSKLNLSTKEKFSLLF